MPEGDAVLAGEGGGGGSEGGGGGGDGGGGGGDVDGGGGEADAGAAATTWMELRVPVSTILWAGSEVVGGACSPSSGIRARAPRRTAERRTVRAPHRGASTAPLMANES